MGFLEGLMNNTQTVVEDALNFLVGLSILQCAYANSMDELIVSPL